jgi:hypothetical protein
MAVLGRVVDDVRERLCWRFLVHGRIDPTHERASGGSGPFDPDRRRCLKRGEPFQRLDRAGRPRTYQGLSWRSLGEIEVEYTAVPAAPAPGEGHRSMSTELVQSELDAAERKLAVAEHELEIAVGLVPNATRAEKTVANERLESVLEGVRSSRTRLCEVELLADKE